MQNAEILELALDLAGVATPPFSPNLLPGRDPHFPCFYLSLHCSQKKNPILCPQLSYISTSTPFACLACANKRRGSLRGFLWGLVLTRVHMHLYAAQPVSSDEVLELSSLHLN